MAIAPFTSLIFPDEAATAQFASGLAPLLTAGDVLLFDGPIGAGKTAFCRALIQARMAAVSMVEDVPSPTFTLVQTYELPDSEIWHADLYRLTHPDETVELGLDEAFTTAICLIEWPDRLGDAAPPDALTISLTVAGDTDARHAAFTSTNPDRWSDRITAAASLSKPEKSPQNAD